MDKNISAEQLIKLVQESELDRTIKEILIRDIQSEGVNEFLLEQVIAYCDNAIAILDSKTGKVDIKNPSA